jgi:broad specificity phosphatase PhoE
MKLLVVRYGETQPNAEHRYLGALDPDLNAKGISQVVALRETLPMSVGAVVCSPLRRARQTAEIVCRGRLFRPLVNEAFRERNVGVFEGLTQDEARTRFPALWAQTVTRGWESAPTGGETISMVVARVANGLSYLYENYGGQVVVIVAHGFVAKVARAIALASFEDFFTWQLTNGAVCDLTLTANPSIEGTLSGLRPPNAPHVNVGRHCKEVKHGSLRNRGVQAEAWNAQATCHCG